MTVEKSEETENMGRAPAAQVSQANCLVRAARNRA
jgi:hypothetical protein